MIISPILPLWIIIPITVVILFLIIRYSKGVKMILRISILILLFVINIRIRVPNGEVNVLNSNLDVIFVVDTTLSMDAIDYNGDTRMSHVREDLKYIIDKLHGSRYSIITYDTIKTVIPFTYDNTAVKTAVDIIKVPDYLYAQGSTITAFKPELKNQLESSKKKENKRRVVFIVSDGEDTNGQGLESLTDLKQYVEGGAVLGYGTTQGGKIKITDYSGEEKYLEDRTSSYPYKDAVSVIDENNLRKMANDLGIDYIHMNNQKDVNSIIDKASKLKDYVSEDEAKKAYQDIYFYISPIIMILFAIELALDRRLFQ